MFGVDEGFGLGVAVSGDGAPAVQDVGCGDLWK